MELSSIILVALANLVYLRILYHLLVAEWYNPFMSLPSVLVMKLIGSWGTNR